MYQCYEVQCTNGESNDRSVEMRRVRVDVDTGEHERTGKVSEPAM
jgi:hypothetical protein